MPESSGVDTRIRLSPRLAVPTVTVVAPLTTSRVAVSRPSRGIVTVCGGPRCAPEQPARATAPMHTATHQVLMPAHCPATRPVCLAGVVPRLQNVVLCLRYAFDIPCKHP